MQDGAAAATGLVLNATKDGVEAGALQVWFVWRLDAILTARPPKNFVNIRTAPCGHRGHSKELGWV